MTIRSRNAGSSRGLRAACSCCRSSSCSGWRCPQAARGRAPAGRHRGHRRPLAQCVDCHTQSSPRHRRPLEGQHARREGRRLRRLPPGRGKGRRRLRPLRRADRHHRHAARLRPLPPDRVGRVRRTATTPRPATSWPRSTTSWPRRSRARACRSTRIRRRPARRCQAVNGMAPRQLGLPAVPRLLVAFQANDGGLVTMRDLKPDAERPADQPRRGRPDRQQRERQAACFSSTSWPNTGIGRINLDGSLGLVRGLPQPARLLAAPRPPAGELRQVPPRPRPSAEGDLRRVEARRGLPRPASPR